MAGKRSNTICFEKLCTGNDVILKRGIPGIENGTKGTVVEIYNSNCITLDISNSPMDWVHIDVDFDKIAFVL